MTGFITNPGFNRSRKISFDVRAKEAAQSLASKSQVDNTLDIADKNREIRKSFKHLTKCLSLAKVI